MIIFLPCCKKIDIISLRATPKKLRAIFFVSIVSIFFITQYSFSQHIKVIGHRGASTLAPENTLASFKKAIDIGVDYLELDVWNSYDDSLMVIHDNTIDRTTNGTGTVTALKYFQIRRWDAGSWFDSTFKDEKIPTLREVLALMKEKNARACVEVKNTQYTANVVNLIKEMGLVDNVYLCCFYISALIEAKSIEPTMKVLYYVDPVSFAEIDTLKNIGGSVIGSGNGNTQEMINYAHQQGIEFWPWTIDDSISMRSFIAKNVDAIITNYPQVLLSIRDSLALGVKRNDNQIPTSIILNNYPNPFNPSTTIKFSLHEQSAVSLSVFDILGRRITTLMNHQPYTAGNFSVAWNASNAAGGNYIIRLQTEKISKSIIVTLIK